MRRSCKRFRPSIEAELEDRLLLHRSGVAAELQHSVQQTPVRRYLPLSVAVNETSGNFASFNQLVTSYVHVLFNFNGSFPSPGTSGATSSNPDGTMLLSSNYNQSIASVTAILSQSVATSISNVRLRPGTAALISARINGSSPDSLVSQLTAVPVSALASQGPSSSSAQAAAFLPITQAIDSAQSDVIAALIAGSRARPRWR